MPIYVYRCLQCQREFDRTVPMAARDAQRCDCGGAVERLFPLFHTPTFKPQWDENLGPGKVFIESEKQYKAELKKRGLVSSWDGV